MNLVSIAFIIFGALASQSVFAQEYSFEAESPRRPAPARITPGFSGAVETRPTPVPILKQINRHNEDGSYTYGYEGADGSFKIETKSNNGEVKGKYGYVDGSGKLRVVEYGANKYGFQPAGEGITVAPPTLVDETTSKEALAANNLEREEEGNYYQPIQVPQPIPVRSSIAKPRPRPVPKYQDFSIPQSSPVPARPLSIPGASATGVVYSERPSQFSSQSRPSYSAPAPSAPRFASQFSNAGPIQFEEPAPVQQQFEDERYSAPASPVSQTRPSYQQQPIHYAQLPIQQRSAPRQSGGSILDQLARDYALPSNGAPALHDITFGSY